jgi:hypothetical protein
MGDIAETIKDSPKETMGFFKHVFKFDGDSKVQVLNMFQYTLLSVLPVVILLKAIKQVIPDVDEKKSSLEISAEILGQLFMLTIGILAIHRMVDYIPTYSGKDYMCFNETTFIIAFLIILFTMQTKLGDKVTILVERVTNLIQGKKEEPKDEKKGQVKVTQPLAPTVPTHQPSQADYLNSGQSFQPPHVPMVQPQQAPAAQMAPQQSPSFDGMYQEPMAANEAFSGGSLF